MFVWKTESILGEFARQMPALSESLLSIGEAYNSANYNIVLSKIWHELTTETIDYGIMENAKQVAVVPASGLGWSDVGSWDSLFDEIGRAHV